MALTRLLDQDAQRERRSQQLLQERLSRVAERLIAREITAATREMVQAWEASGNVPTTPDHQKRIDALLKRIWMAAIAGMGRRINEAVKSSHGPAVAKQEDRYDLYMQEYLAAFGGEKIIGISETTRQQVINQIELGRREGLGQRDIAKLIMQRSPTIGRQRAALIARTETHSAGNYGAMQSAKDSGVQMQREWIASGGGRTRNTHEAADGQIVGMDEPFRVGGAELMYPGDPHGPADETINCRCAVGYVVAD